ncbi:MAG: hypothetical protein V5B40_15730 [Candidatus Accumulibacter meliphilus]|uniref:hypothetical protein n=1 Tax=Candidatus Accumulibacter meliphilus TaxID=2211374 RepID=UPI002FC2BE4B
MAVDAASCYDALTACEQANTVELAPVEAVLLRSLDFVGGTTLKRIKPLRLLALIVEDVGRYPQSRIGDIHQRSGLEIPRSRIRRGIEQLLKDGKLHSEGIRSGTRYGLP